MMTLEQFRSLPGDLQRQFVQHRGVFLLSRSAVGLTAKLYQVDGFYVELLFDERLASISRVSAFIDTGKLEPYLRQVDMRELWTLL